MYLVFPLWQAELLKGNHLPYLLVFRLILSLRLPLVFKFELVIWMKNDWEKYVKFACYLRVFYGFKNT